MVELGVRQQRLVAGELAFRLGELHLEGARVDLGEQVALLHDLAFLEQHPHELPFHTASDSGGPERRHRPEPIEVHVDIAGLRRRRHHRNRPIGQIRPPLSRSGVAGGDKLAVAQVSASEQ